VARAGRRAPQHHLCADGAADVRADATWQGDHWQLRSAHAGGARCHHAAHGRPHNVRNALAAAACALAAGAPLDAVAQGLEAFAPVKGRSRALLLSLHGGAPSRWWTTATTPTPTRCAPPSTCWPICPPALLVLGDMGEVGDQGPPSTPKWAPMRASAASSTLWTLGALCAHAARPTARRARISTTWHPAAGGAQAPCRRPGLRPVGDPQADRAEDRPAGPRVRRADHLAKRGTPTMGGVLILLGIGVSTLLWFDWTNRFVWIVMLVTFGFGAIGWVDDWRKVVNKDPEGMRSREKYFWQSVIGLVAALYLAFSVSETSTCACWSCSCAGCRAAFPTTCRPSVPT
jgi:hypothetical protein